MLPRRGTSHVRGTCRTCDHWCPLNGERRNFAALGFCAADGNLGALEPTASCSMYTPSQPTLADVAGAAARAPRQLELL